MTLAFDGDVHAAAEDFRNGNERVAGGLRFRIEQAAGDDDLQCGDDGRRSIRIDCERGEQRENGVLESGGDLGRLGDGKAGRLERPDAGLFKRGDEGAGEQGVLVRAHLEDALAQRG